MSRFLALDIGASSGRAMLADFDGNTITMREVHRFANEPVRAAGALYWDILRIFHEIKEGMRKAAAAGGFDYIGIDTWGVDFALIDKNGRPMQNPVHYRDSRTDGWESVFKKMPRNELFRRTGIQMMQINTVFQLYALKCHEPELLSAADKMMFIPDLLAYFLTDNMSAEYTLASTSQLVGAHSCDWDTELLEKLGLPKSIFLPVEMPGSFYGELSAEIQNELNCGAAKVVRTAAHDTASAVLAMPPAQNNAVFISCGTWSLLGTEIDEPILSTEAYENNFSNEGGAFGEIRFLKNIMGLWILQEARRRWSREGRQYNFSELESLAEEAEPLSCFIDPDDRVFIRPGDMPRRIRDYCLNTGQNPPGSIGAYVRCIDESLALKYRMCIEQTEHCTKSCFSEVSVLGGGAQSRLLCQMTANATGRRVTAGPTEATAFGNIAMQLIAAGEIKDKTRAREAVARSSKLVSYEPRDNELWNTAYRRFCKLIKK